MTGVGWWDMGAGPWDGFSTMDRELSWDSSGDSASGIRAISLLVWMDVTGGGIGPQLEESK